ncbi:MAG TPA: hypothetical protein VGG57_21720 [Stellaceae bacterium]|jgi:hypothetical protein
MARYEAGETLASIARTYDCSPPAISYIVSRSRERQPEAEAPVPAAEPQLVKNQVPEPAPAAVVAAPEPALALAPAEPAPPFAERSAGLAATLARGMPHRSNGDAAAPQPAAPQPNGQLTNGDGRRTLHLSLGGNGPANGAANGAHSNGHSNGNGAEPQSGNGFRAPERPYAPPQAQPHERAEQPARPMPQPRYGFPQQGERSFNDTARPDADSARRNKDTGNFIDQELRDRVDGDIAAFLAAFDAALAGDTLESRAGLREATDRLLRAGARTRIELERLEARVPLGARDSEGRGEPNWRHR